MQEGNQLPESLASLLHAAGGLPRQLVTLLVAVGRANPKRAAQSFGTKNADSMLDVDAIQDWVYLKNEAFSATK